MSSKPILIGLHVTKCAGTSLANQVQRQMHPNSWYLCSSFWQNQQQAILELPDRIDLEAINFIFGHYVHESMLALFSSRPMLLFLGIRAPVKRVISEYYHMCWVGHLAGRPPITAEDFLSVRQNTMCQEILRAFPTANAEMEGALSEKALAVTDVFGLIYESETFAESTAPLLQLLGLPQEESKSLNERKIDTDAADFLAEQTLLVEATVPEAFAEDIKLYEALKPRIGIYSGPAPSWDSQAPDTVPEWLRMILAEMDPMAALSKHLTGFMARDFYNVGQRASLERLIEQRKASLTGLSAAELRLPAD